MTTVFDQLIDHIALYLPPKDLYYLLTLNKKYNSILTSDRFWRRKTKKDYNITRKREHQTWIDRYKLASSMGHIVIHDLCNELVHFDIGVELNIDHFSNTRLLPYKAITAILVRPCLYYIDDDYNLYMVGEPNYAGRIYKVPTLLDINVTKLDGGPHDFFYIKEGDIYYHADEGTIRITNRHDIIDFSLCGSFISYITTTNKLYQLEYNNDTDEWLSTDREQSDVISVLQYYNAQIWVNKNGQITTDNILLREQIKNYPALTNIVDTYGDFLFVTAQGELISMNVLQPADPFDIDRELEYYFKHEFPNIQGIIDANICYDTSYIMVIGRTKKGELYINTPDNKVIKLNLKAKNICKSPTNNILIV